jgi:hypothetical protein
MEIKDASSDTNSTIDKPEAKTSNQQNEPKLKNVLKYE